MAKQATYKNYTVTIEDSGSVIVKKDGKQCDNTAVVLREIAESISLAVDAKWNTRQLGAKVYKEISDGAAPSAKTDKKTTDTKEKKATAKPSKSDSKELDAAQAEIERLKAELAKAQKAAAPKAETPTKKSKSNDLFEGLMVKVCAGMFNQDTSYFDKEYYYPGDDHRKKQEIRYCKRSQSRRVTISKEFQICKYPVTQGQWKAIMGEGFNPSHFRGDDNLPVEMVSWEECQEFIKKLNEKTGKKYRLPYEAEWQWAAMGAAKDDDRGAWSGCDKEADLNDYAWYSGISESKTHPVGKKKPNELGLYDMSGNVREWCQDWYVNDRGATEVKDPQGPTCGSYRVQCGGSWCDTSSTCRVSDRNCSSPSDRRSYLGFRLALDM